MTLPPRRGFTLVEVLVALVVSVLVVSAVRLAFEQIGAATSRTSAAAAALQHDAHGQELLRALVARLDIAPSDSGVLTGDERDAAFESWCDTADGWQRRCRVHISVASAGGALVVKDDYSTRGTGIDLGARALCYLADAADGGRWQSEWSSSVAAPLAIGVVTTRDTLLFIVGGRG